ADAVGLGVIKSFGKWEMVAAKDIWAQKQIATAVASGIGKGRGDIVLKNGDGDERFESLMRSVRESTGLF
ncbi:MAG: hypothetical protein HY890_08385, partial [Deltaproteobacteria bacterium]|nr:hypothetical protein [Deltaproteobacteria bacterium]